MIGSLLFASASIAAAAQPSSPIDPQHITLGSSAGDSPGEEQPPPTGYPIPPAPVLSPEEALKTFKLPPGYRIEIVAVEPLVETPVAIDFDPDGRIWVVEMRGYQTDPEGSERLKPIGRIVVLEDSDGDGRMDRRTIYMDGLVLPRAVRVLTDGVLVAEPPFVWHTRDTDGDLRADEKGIITDDYGVRESNPGHAPNGLMRGMDNWFHSSTYSSRLRQIEGKWVKEPVPLLGHWGMGMDDFGRTFMNTNSAPLRVNLIATHYLVRNPRHEGIGGIFFPMTGAADREVHPIRPTPGVNRGYTKGILRSDGRLHRYTAGCGVSIYRGDRLPAEMQGNHFFCEPAAHLVRRTVLTENKDGTLSGTNAHPGAEFLVSTDERFRPVNTCTAPDGTLHIVDMHRGVLETHPFVTTYLKRQIYERNLLHPLNQGRIYRIVHESMQPGPPPKMSGAAASQLIQWLGHANGWWRDTAQRLLVEKRDPGAAKPLRELAFSTAPEIPRLHALWTLEGLNALTPEDIERAAQDASPHLRSAAVRMAEPWLRQADAGAQDMAAVAIAACDDRSASVRLQAAATIGELAGKDADAALVRVLSRHAQQPGVVDAVMSGAKDRELRLLNELGRAAEWHDERPDRAQTISALAASAIRSGKAETIEPLLGWAASTAQQTPWQTLAALRSIDKAVPVDRAVLFPKELTDAAAPQVREAAAQLQKWLEPESADGLFARELTAAEKSRIESGARVYTVYCAQCHQADGRGLPDLAPALDGSKWVKGPAPLLARIVLHGKQDNLLIMPPWNNVLSDDHIAAILTYIRQSWSNRAAPVSAEQVRQIRAAPRATAALWTEERLLRGRTKGRPFPAHSFLTSSAW